MHDVWLKNFRKFPTLLGEAEMDLGRDTDYSAIAAFFDSKD